MFAIGIIPARYASSRFPGKPLAIINGKSMIQRVYEQSMKSEMLSEIIVATDDNSIKNHVTKFKGKAIMTSEFHKSGTERCNEVVKMLYGTNMPDVVVNIQGDEPYINPSQIDKIVSCFENQNVQIATLAKEIISTEVLFNPNVVKVVFGKDKKAIYFSRSPIPYLRGKESTDWINETEFYKHIGIYAYRPNILKSICELNPSKLEKAESLEQLRWLENGYSIQVEITDFESYSVDIPEDILKFKG
ncbi:MAG: 3-deoxy-manno-octulosonate cytidylyltransferase [Bacteroidales bacterium]|nr:3-deoxy-manno-octulosonate cytidylyltransferase [Bacteroidales bacterium]